MKTRNTLSRGQCLIALAAVFTFISPAQAQEKLRSVVHFRLKPERAAEFRAAVKEYAAVLKSAHWDKAGTWWAAESGPAEMVLVRYHSKFAELDTARDPKLKDVAPQLTAINARMMQCTESVERTVQEILPETSLPRANQIPKMVRTLRITVRPDKVEDYLALVKSELFPAIKKAGVTNYQHAVARFGASRNVYISSTGIDNWAALDSPSPVIHAMGGDQAYRQFLAKHRQLVTEVLYNVYRFLPDLSYVPTT